MAKAPAFGLNSMTNFACVQIQLNMYLTGTNMAHLFVYSSQDSLLVEVPRDDQFLLKLVQDLEKAYISAIPPHLKTSE